MSNLTKRDIIKTIIDEVEEDITDKELIQIILDKKVSKNKLGEKYTLGQKAADFFAKIAGSWGFIIGFMTALIFWIFLNTFMNSKAFDPYPFILLNLVLSCVAAVQAPLILMSQNREEEKDRKRAENDYKVNLKTEIIIEDLYNKIDEILKNQKKII